MNSIYTHTCVCAHLNMCTCKYLNAQMRTQPTARPRRCEKSSLEWTTFGELTSELMASVNDKGLLRAFSTLVPHNLCRMMAGLFPVSLSHPRCFYECHE